MVICHTLLQTWRMTHVIFIFHFGLFFALYPPNSPKNQNVKKWKQRRLEISFYKCVPKIMIRWSTFPEIWCTTDGWTDWWTDERKEKLTYGGGCTMWKIWDIICKMVSLLLPCARQSCSVWDSWLILIVSLVTL